MTEYFIAGIAAVFIGLSKAGFGGGLGMLTTPLCVLAFSSSDRSPAFAVGVLLPLLCAGDAFSIVHFWRKWAFNNLLLLLPGVLIGVLVGVQCIGRFNARQINVIIGSLALVFLGFHLVKEWLVAQSKPALPHRLGGWVFGIIAGITSTFAHGAGPVVTLFLLPQKLSKELFVGTSVLIFTWINWIKMPFFIHQGIIDKQSFLVSLMYLPLVPIGVRLGVWCNRSFSERLFGKLVYLLTFIAAFFLVTGINPVRWFTQR